MATMIGEVGGIATMVVGVFAGVGWLILTFEMLIYILPPETTSPPWSLTVTQANLYGTIVLGINGSSVLRFLHIPSDYDGGRGCLKVVEFGRHPK